MSTERKRVGIFGWGVVAPRSPNIEAFEKNLERATTWLKPFDGFGPSNFLVGEPDFDFSVYRPWIDQRFEPRRFSMLDAKMGDMVKYALGAFIQALGQNPGLEEELKSLGSEAHVYVGTGLGDFSVQYDIAREYQRAQRRWNRFWCKAPHCPPLERYRSLDEAAARELLVELEAPADLADHDPTALDPYDDGFLEASDRWHEFWARHSQGLADFLAELQEIEAEGIGDDVESSKGHVIRRKLAARKKLRDRWQCPTEPWNAVDARLLWNIPNIPAAQISMLGGITGPAVAPIAACAGFGAALKLADAAIQAGEAKVVVVGTTDPKPHPLTVGSFYQARVMSHDGRVSKPFTGMRGTHVSGGACVWIVGDADYLMAKGMQPLGLEIVGVAVSSDADHIITPSEEGPRSAMRRAMAVAQVEPEEVSTWDMHATATPGDWQELQNALAVLPGKTRFTARKGSFGHGMSVCGGWELTAQHLGVVTGKLHPVDLQEAELHPQVQPYFDSLVLDQPEVAGDGSVAGKINMGIGGINACVICRTWGRR
ncbi:MAG: beta-ketoacyl synthase N-terminal-like domain-containing protein [Acidobacteriota bacterium]|nr:beta-ketoacyl synthase N-terminal-like domain-containing protein [Acidobacteriota bacterium]